MSLMLFAAVFAAHVAADAEASRVLEPTDLRGLTWRSVGPANMGGRVAALALAPGNPKSIFVGYATGGLWHSTNRGTTCSPIFDESISFSPASTNRRSIVSVRFSISSMLTGRFWQALRKPSMTFKRSKVSRRLSFLITMGSTSSMRS